MTDLSRLSGQELSARFLWDVGRLEVQEFTVGPPPRPVLLFCDDLHAWDEVPDLTEDTGRDWPHLGRVLRMVRERAERSRYPFVAHVLTDLLDQTTETGKDWLFGSANPVRAVMEAAIRAAGESG